MKYIQKNVTALVERVTENNIDPIKSFVGQLGAKFPIKLRLISISSLYTLHCIYTTLIFCFKINCICIICIDNCEEPC